MAAYPPKMIKDWFPPVSEPATNPSTNATHTHTHTHTHNESTNPPIKSNKSIIIIEEKKKKKKKKNIYNYRIWGEERDVNLVDVGAVTRHLTGDFPSSEGNVHALACFQYQRRWALKARADQIALAVLERPAAGTAANAITPHCVTRPQIAGAHCLYHSRVVQTVVTLNDHFGADYRTFG